MKNFIQRINVFLINLTDGALSFVKRCVKPAIKLVEDLKSLIDGDLVDVVINFTPSQIDNLAVKTLRAVLPDVLEILKDLTMFQNCLLIEGDKERLDCFLITLNQLSIENRTLFKKILTIIADKFIKREADLLNINSKRYNIEKLIELTYSIYKK